MGAAQEVDTDIHVVEVETPDPIHNMYHIIGSPSGRAERIQFGSKNEVGMLLLNPDVANDVNGSIPEIEE